MKKSKTLNEAVMEMGNQVTSVVSPVYADAVITSAEKRKNIKKLFDEQKINLPNEDRFAHQKVNGTKEMKKMKLSESLFTEWLTEESNMDKLTQTYPDEVKPKNDFNNWDSPESRIDRYETDLPELMATMHDLYMNGRLDAEVYAEALKIAYDAFDSVP